MISTTPRKKESLPALVGDVITGASDLFVQHLKAAREEIKNDVGALLSAGGAMAAMLVPVLLGYLLALVALAIAIGGRLGLTLGFLIVGLANMALGSAGMYLAWRRGKQIKVGDETAAEVRRSVTVLSGRNQIES